MDFHFGLVAAMPRYEVIRERGLLHCVTYGIVAGHKALFLIISQLLRGRVHHEAGCLFLDCTPQTGRKVIQRLRNLH